MTDSTTTRGSDEEKLSRAVAIGLPLVTLASAAIVGVTMNAATSILVLVAGLLLGVIALFWNSLRILTGDAPLSPELEALDTAARGVDALASRKKMLVRALKDLENERGLGKIEAEDYEPIAQTYREELKLVLRRMDEALEPHRSRAEDAVRRHLAKAGLSPTSASKAQARPGKAAATPAAEPDASSTQSDDAPARVECPKCQASNEVDAKFCKECATSLANAKTEVDATTSTNDASDDDEDTDEK